MCKDCGCGVVNNFIIEGIKASERENASSSVISTDSAIEDRHKHTITIHQKILDKNDRLAARNRDYFRSKKLLVINLLSSPGAGKTALIERMIEDCRSFLNIGVIVGDLATDNDARRLRSAGASAIQITTGNTCHLEADMIARAIVKLDLHNLDLLIIENVGNLVCPAAYDLGEDLRVVLLSVTEGEDKPLKYPIMFKSAGVVIINKIDIAEAVGFDRETAIANLQKIAPKAKILEVSAKSGQGMENWNLYLKKLQIQKVTG